MAVPKTYVYWVWHSLRIGELFILLQTLCYQIKPVVTIAACLEMKLAEITLSLHVVLFVMIFWRVSEERKKSRQHRSQTRSMSCLLVLVPSHVVMDVSSHVIRNRVLLCFKGNKNVGELCFSSMASSAVLHCFLWVKNNCQEGKYLSWFGTKEIRGRYRLWKELTRFGFL